MHFFDTLASLQDKPPLFTPGAPLWTDPYIAQQMLKAHLNPDHDLASRRPATIDAAIDWVMTLTGLRAGDKLLDLGCGPGLYTRRFAERSIHTTGIDFSANSIAYAAEHDPATTYRCEDYLTLSDVNAYDVITLIYGDFCVLSDEDRDNLLTRIRRALKKDESGKPSYFVFDVTMPAAHAWLYNHNEWYFVPSSGFWRAEPHLVLEKGYTYPEHDTFLHQYHVIDKDMTLTTYNNWFHDYTSATILPVLEKYGFQAELFTHNFSSFEKNEDAQWCWIAAFC